MVNFLASSLKEGLEVYRNIIVVTNRFTKIRLFIPCLKINTRSTANLFVREVFKRFNLSDVVVSDRGT